MNKTLALILTSAMSLLTLNACEKQDPDETPNPYTPISLTKAEEAIADGANAFGFDVYHALYKDEQMLVSPLSLSLVLSMTACGAEGRTAEQMCSTLGFGDSSTEEVAGYYKKMVSCLQTIDNKSTFEIANSIWIEKRLDVKKDFISRTDKYFSSEVRNVDFDSSSTADAINKWCSDNTHGKISKIIEKLDPGTVMALINALYFKGKWAFEFNDKTRSEQFTTISGSKVKHDMMSATERLRYSSSEGYEMVSLPYGNGAFQMSVILPPKDIPFAKAADNMDDGRWNALNSSLTTCNVNLKIPEFKFEYSSDLGEVLKALGMTDAFSASADFSGISDASLYIDSVIQKTFIEVNTKGTEAAAATIVTMKLTAAGPPQEPKNVDFIADRPFLFVISEQSTGAILFIGQKVD